MMQVTKRFFKKGNPMMFPRNVLKDKAMFEANVIYSDRKCVPTSNVQGIPHTTNFLVEGDFNM